ncbi:MAG TPA: hypothetical protein VFG50_16505 [Rhodothermales bacterium]|nr:hypothetical protein [Rhodothermales bacterium]
MHPLRRVAAILTLAITAGLLGTGCEENVDPVLGIDLPYSVYALFTPALDTQWVRVFPIEGTLKVRTKEKLDATVTSTDVTTGEKRVWTDSLIEGPTGLFEHGYWSDFRAEYGHRYELEVTRSDGATSSATTAVPAQVIASIDPTILAPQVVVPYRLQTDAKHLLEVEVTYQIIRSTDPRSPTGTLGELITLPYDDAVQPVDGGWMVLVDLTTDFDRLRSELVKEERYDPAFGIAIVRVAIDLIVASEEWAPPGGVFDPTIIGLPNALTNVQNGFGLVVSGFRLHNEFVPTDDESKQAGFRPLSQV